MAHFIVTTEKTLAEGLAKLFRDHVWKLYRLPESIISDRGVQFAAGMMKKVNNLLGIQTKLLKWQMKGRRLEKLTEHFVGPYKIKGIVSSNAIELELPKTIKIHPVVNVSRV